MTSWMVMQNRWPSCRSRGNCGVFFSGVNTFFYDSEIYFLNATMGKLLSSFELDFYFAL